uniref:receptor protein-tyrosine kinase n=1 Tax=Takifugu rubripes TaxID=31033 RepID=A0A674NTL7_TAKRU
VCSGWSQVSWLFPQDALVDGVAVEDQGSISILNIFNATWKHSGRYTCEEGLSSQSKSVDIFIPGPEEWFLLSDLGVVMKEKEEGTIPCLVSDPQLNVSLYERPDIPVTGLMYEPGRGFTGPLNDTSYLCVASNGRQKIESQVYYVFSVIGEESHQLRGEVLTVNCTVKDTEMVYFFWDFPRKQVPAPLPPSTRDFLSHPPHETSSPTLHTRLPLPPSTRDFLSHPPHETSSPEYMSTLKLVRVRMDQTGNYAATAYNEDAEEEVVFHLEIKAPPKITSLSEISNKVMLCVSEGAPPPSSLSNFSPALYSQVAVLAAVLVLVFITVVFLIVLILLWRKKPRYEVRWKVIESVSPDGQQYTYLDPTHLPYNSTWEVPRDNISLGPVLGSGAFGRVVEANVSGLLHSHSTTKVAIKMVKSNSGAVQSLMSELKVLVHLGPHLNIVNLLGACTRGGPVYLITEFCRHGDLVSYLERNRHTFLQRDKQKKSDADGGYMDMNKEESVEYVTMTKLSYADIEPAVYETPYTPAGEVSRSEAMLLLSDSPLLTLHDLLSFSFQVAQAMDFLSSRNCLHRDLAARNVLVCEGKLVKVCDFGLARDLTKDQDYVAKGTSFLPVKWMSPESIFQNIYSCQSDVWSYGILLWEIFSLGGSPYPDVPLTQEFYSALKRGYRMNRPEHAPQSIFDLMKQCWEEKPQSRPTFSSLVVSVGNMLTDDYKKRYHNLAENFLKGEQPAVLRSRAAGDQNRETDANGPFTKETCNGSHSPER